MVGLIYIGSAALIIISWAIDSEVGDGWRGHLSNGLALLGLSGFLFAAAVTGSLGLAVFFLAVFLLGVRLAIGELLGHYAYDRERVREWKARKAQIGFWRAIQEEVEKAKIKRGGK